jgi:DNA-binding NarL/FixJ family response regulator
VVLLDNNFPENNSLKLLAEIKTHHFACKVIMLSNQHNAYINNQCNVRGANFIIDKNNEVDKLDSLLTAIKTGGSIN